MVQRADAGDVGAMTLRALDGMTEALGAVLVTEVRWHGADLDHLIDRDHAALEAAVVPRLERDGWEVRVEVSFNHFGDRGRCDLVAWHAPARTLLIVEVKTRIGDLQDALGRLDVKVRLGSVIAEQLGWGRPAGVAGALVLAEGGTNRRLVRVHEPLFRRFALRGRAAQSWVRLPTSGTSQRSPRRCARELPCVPGRVLATRRRRPGLRGYSPRNSRTRFWKWYTPFSRFAEKRPVS